MVRLDTVMQCALKKLSQDKVFQAPTVRVNLFYSILSKLWLTSNNNFCAYGLLNLPQTGVQVWSMYKCTYFRFEL